MAADGPGGSLLGVCCNGIPVFLCDLCYSVSSIFFSSGYVGAQGDLVLLVYVHDFV